MGWVDQLSCEVPSKLSLSVLEAETPAVVGQRVSGGSGWAVAVSDSFKGVPAWLCLRSWRHLLPVCWI